MSVSVNDIGSRIGGNPYPGRGIVVGMSADGQSAVIAYFIMGRSANSRNRVLRLAEDSLFTRPYDESKVQDPSLIIYRAARYVEGGVILTNGDQTDTIYQAMQSGEGFEAALATRTYEPDAPNYTPRISALLTYEQGAARYEMSILRRVGDGECERATFRYAARPGTGHLLHTYRTDGDPLPSFAGAPKEVSIANDSTFADEIWQALDEDNKISLYVAYIDLATGKRREKIYNKKEME